MKIKTSELEGSALDWAVAKALGWRVTHVPADANGENAGEVLAPPTVKDGEWVFPPKGRIGPRYFLKNWSSDWGQGGPMIASRRVMLEPLTRMDHPEGGWHAGFKDRIGVMHGPSPLIAAMRAIVAAELGDEVDVPDELEKDA